MGFTDLCKVYFKKFRFLLPYLVVKTGFNIALVKLSLGISDIKKLYSIDEGTFQTVDKKHIIIMVLLIFFVNIIVDSIFYCFAGVLSKKILNDENITQLETFKETFKYLKRYILLLLAICGIGIGIAAIAMIFAVFMNIPVLGVILIIAMTICFISFTVIFSSCGEYLIYTNCRVGEALNDGRSVGKKFFWRILLLFVCIGLIGYSLKYNLNSIVYTIILFINISVETFGILYRMNLCKTYIEDIKEETITV